MSALKVGGVTSKYYNKKCVEYGAVFNEQLTLAKKSDIAVLKSQHSKEAANGNLDGVEIRW